MKKTIFISFFFLNLLSCKKEEIIQNPPSVLTKEASEIVLAAPYSNVTLNGEVSDEGFAAVTDRGFVYSDKNTTPSVSDNKVKSGYGKGTYFVKLTNLDLNKKFYYRSYATSAKATSYGSVQSFITADYKLATIITQSLSLINNTYIEFKGEVKDTGGGEVKEYGFVVSKKSSPTLSNAVRIIFYSGQIVNQLPPLNLTLNADADTKYFVRSYVINEKGESYGNELTITTSNKIETVVNTVISPVTKRVWMDRNLGASRAAISREDALAKGDLYQWGRNADGHQISVSETTSTLSNSDIAPNGLFITTPIDNSDWKVTPNNNLWQVVNGLNNVCPTGFRIPTINEFKAEEAVFKDTNLGALKFTTTYIRNNEGIIIANYFSSMSYWTSTVLDNSNYAYILNFGAEPQISFRFLHPKSRGTAIRCIKN